MEINELREYILLAQRMNFTKAAQELFISQPTLSNHIMGIEAEVGMELIDRSHSGIRFTVAGYNFLETASEMINLYDTFIQQSRGGDYSKTNHFVIQTLQHADRATLIILQRIKEFKLSHPDVQIEIKESLSYDVLDNMQKNIVDCGYFGFFLHEPEVSPGYVVVPMIEEELIVWLDKTSALYTATELNPKDLECCKIPTWVGLGPNGLESGYEDIYKDYCMKVDYSPRYCISREDYFLNKIAAGDAVILTEGSEAIHSITVREDRGLRSFNPPIFVKTYLLFKDDKENTAINQFEEFLLSKYEDNPRR